MCSLLFVLCAAVSVGVLVTMKEAERDACAAEPAAGASLVMPQLFADGMVLQRHASVPVWGWDRSEQVVVVEFGRFTHSVTTTCDGTWRIDLPPMPPSFAPSEMTIRGSTTLKIRDIVVGDVWLCSGQSNMVMPVKATSHRKVSDGNRSIRQFNVVPAGDLHPQKNAMGDVAYRVKESKRRFHQSHQGIVAALGRLVQSRKGVCFEVGDVCLVCEQYGGHFGSLQLARRNLQHLFILGRGLHPLHDSGRDEEGQGHRFVQERIPHEFFSSCRMFAVLGP